MGCGQSHAAAQGDIAPAVKPAAASDAAASQSNGVGSGGEAGEQKGNGSGGAATGSPKSSPTAQAPSKAAAPASSSSSAAPRMPVRSGPPVPVSVLTDSYKASHFLMYPDAELMVAYGEFRGSFAKDPEDSRFVFYGMR